AGPPGWVLSDDQPGDGTICDTWLGLAMIAARVSVPALLGVTVTGAGAVVAVRISAATASTGPVASCPVISIRVAYTCAAPSREITTSSASAAGWRSGE